MHSEATIAGTFQLIQEIGSDELGVIHRAQDATAEPVWLRVMHADVAESPDRVARFLEAAESWRAIEHANVAPVLAAGVDRVPYVAARWAPGASLDRILSTRRLGVDVTCEIGLHLLAALAAASEPGIHHLHLTPRQVVVDLEARGTVRTQLYDIGIAARVLGASSSTRSRYDQHFLAPEVLGGMAGDGRADIYSVGMILYELIARGATRRAEEPWMRPSHDLGELIRLNPSVPEPLLRSLALALAPDRGARLDSLQEFARLLVPYVRPKLRAAEQVRVNTLDPALREYEVEEVPASLRLQRAPRPRNDSACPEEMLIEPTFPRSPTAPRLESLHADAYGGKRRSLGQMELETVENPAANDAADENAGNNPLARSAALAIGAGVSVGVALAWLGTVI